MIDPARAYREARIAANWWSHLLVRHDETLLADLFASSLEHIPIRPERAGAFQIALVAETEGSVEMVLVLWDGAVLIPGLRRRKVELVGTRPSSEIVRAADSVGLMQTLRHLPDDGAMTAINPGHVVSYAGHPTGPVPTGLVAL